MVCDTDDLKFQTQAFWNELDAAAADAEKIRAAIERYLAGLLPAEIACVKERAAQKPGIWPQEEDHAEVLVLLIGFAIEPLLLSICAYQPKEILLVLNRKYYSDGDGAGFGKRRVVPVIKKLSPTLLPGPAPEIRPDALTTIEEDTPGKVFQFLLRELHNDLKQRRKIVIDITGGKKSMVAGAYLFAAYTGAKISYVDFEDYHESHRRPYGFSCQLGFLPNPYQIFGLRDWEQVRELYEHSFYDRAAKLLDQIARSMPAEYFNNEQIASVDLLSKIMMLYHAWSNGDYRLAKNLSDQAQKLTNKFKPLDAVESLHPHWPPSVQLANPPNINASAIYSQPMLLLKYAHDESEKVKRIVEDKEDYRSGLLRAAGLNEVLYKARVSCLLKNNQITFYHNDHKLEKKQAEKFIAEEIKAYFAQKILEEPNEIEIWEDDNKKKNRDDRKGYMAQKAKDALLFLGKTSETKVKLNYLRKLRNKVTHFVLPIPEDVARDAVRLTQENVQDYEDIWVKPVSAGSASSPARGLRTPPDWQELCNWCDLNFLPYYEK